MADMQIKGVLLEKEWYTLQEVAGRWTRMTGQAVGIDDILHYGKTGKLKISAELPEMGVDRRHIGSDDPIKHFLLGRGVYVLPQETVVGAMEQGRYPFGWLQSTEGAMVIYTPADDAPKVWITKENMLVRIDDIKDFEQAHGLGQPAQLPKPQDDKLDPRKEKTYLQIIRALLSADNFPSEPYKAAELLINHCTAKGLALPSKRDTIAEKIKAAYNLSD